MPAKYYISYRSGDAQASAVRLREWILRHFGAGTVFDAHEGFTPAHSFRDACADAINACDVVIVVIGPKWLNDTSRANQPVWLDPDEYFPFEIAAAVAACKLIVPVLVERARMPTDDELPESLRRFAGCRPVEIGTADLSLRQLIEEINFRSMGSSGQGPSKPFLPVPPDESGLPLPGRATDAEFRLPTILDDWAAGPDHSDGQGDPFGPVPSSQPEPSSPPPVVVRPSRDAKDIEGAEYAGSGPAKSGLPRPSSRPRLPSSKDEWDPLIDSFPPVSARPPPKSFQKRRGSDPGLAVIFGAIGRAISGAVGSITRRGRPSHAHPPSPSGTLGPPAAPTVVLGRSAEPVSLGVTAPTTSTPGARFTVILAAYAESARASVEAKLQRMGGPAASPLMGIAPDRQSGWVVGAPVTVRVTAEGVDVEPAERVFEWNGQENLASFSVLIRSDMTAASIDVCFHVALGGVPIACIPLPVSLKPGGATGDTKTVKSIRTAESAFASYSSKDTVTVEYCLSTLSRWSPDLAIFQDCLDLRPNEAFKPQLTKRITNSDVFLLFWSRSAAASPWCQWELDTARTAKGLQAVIPMPLEDPKIAPPPPEFTEVHMRDRFMVARYAMQRVDEEAARLGPD